MNLNQPEEAEIAFKEAGEEVIDQHARLGLPLYIWRGGKVVGLSGSRATSRFCNAWQTLSVLSCVED
jgi:hypothetical protein